MACWKGIFHESSIHVHVEYVNTTFKCEVLKWSENIYLNIPKYAHWKLSTFTKSHLAQCWNMSSTNKFYRRRVVQGLYLYKFSFFLHQRYRRGEITYP